MDKRVSTQSFSASKARLPPSPTSPTHRFPSRLGPGAGEKARPESVGTRDSVADSFFHVDSPGGPGRPSGESSRRASARGSFMAGLGAVGSVVKHLRAGSGASASGSGGFAGLRVSVLSTGSFGGSSYTNSMRAGASSTSTRLVRQVFTPILPDELTLTLGERLTILQSFDDGWVIVGRSDAKLLSPGGGTGAERVEMGAVPAWCFVRPMKGLRSERPVRSSSLGVTVQVEDQARPREDIISWSNF